VYIFFKTLVITTKKIKLEHTSQIRQLSRDINRLFTSITDSKEKEIIINYDLFDILVENIYITYK